MRLSQFVASLAMVLLFSLLPSITSAQLVYEGNQFLPPWGGFSGSDFDTVSMQNGNLRLQIPLGSYKQRGGSTVTLTFIMDTPTWTRTTQITTSNHQRIYITSLTGPFQHAGVFSNVGGFSLVSSISTTTCAGNPINYYNTWVVTDPEGNKHPVDLFTGGCGSSITQSAPTDGNGMMVNIASNPPLLTLKDGTQIVLSQSAPYVFNSASSEEDTNGNIINNAPDTLGRTLITTTNGPTTTLTSPLGYQRTNQIPYTLYSLKDANGNTQNYRVDNALVDVVTNFCGDLNNPPIFVCHDRGAGSTFVVPSKLTLPDGQTYLFSWVNQSPVELGSVTLPTGGTLSYTYSSGCSHEPIITGSPYNSTTVPYDCRAGVASRTVTINGVNNTWTYSTTSPKVTDPNGNDEVHVFGYVVVNNVSSLSTVEKQVSYYSGSSSSGTLLKSVTTDYTGEQNSCTWDCSLINVRPIRVTTTLDNGLVTKTETDYETFSVGSVTATRLNPTEKREYDYGSGAPGALLRRADYTYLHNNNSTYANLNIVDRPASVITHDGSGNTVAQTTYEYDVYNHSGLPSMGSSGAVQHDSARGTNYTTRGNQTGVSKWVNTTSSWLTTNNQFDDAGNIIATKDPRGNVTNFDYTDSWNNTACAPSGQGKAYLTKITNPLSQLVTKSYDSCTGSLASSKDQNDINAGRAGTTYSYDMFGRTTQVNYPDGGQTTFCFTDTGGASCTQSSPPFQLVTTRLAAPSPNSRNTTLFDGLGRPTETQLNSDPDCSSGDKTDTTYDALGRVHTVSNPYCSTSDPIYGLTTYTYDALGRTCVVAPPAGTPQSSCPASAIAGDVITVNVGRATAVFDEGNGTRAVERISQVDGLGRLASVCEVTSASQLGSTGAPAACGQDISATGFLTTYSYDTIDNLTSVSQSGLNSRSFQYDSLSRLTSASNPESGTITYTYDADSNVHTRTDARNITTTYAYDSLNRLTGKTYSDSTPAATFNYDQTSALGVTLTNTNGRKSSESTAGALPTGSVFSYDSMGRIADNSQCTPQNCGTGVFAFQYPQYDLLGDLVSGTNAAGVSFTYSYNGAARVTGITTNFVDASHPGTLLSNATYNAPGLLNSVRLGNGITETRNYNSRLRMTSFFAGTVYSLNMASYAPNGDVLADNDSVNGNWTYSYDDFNRLGGSNQNSGQSVYSYLYDRFGNRWQQNGQHSMQLSFSGANNRMDGHSYDAAGNLLNDGSCGYTYDAESRISTVGGNCPAASYVYDAEGRRVRKTTSAATLDFLYDTDGHKVAEVDTTGTFQRGELYASGRHFAVYTPDPGPTGATFFIHADWLGTERARTNMAGVACETITSLPFGDGQTISDSCGDSAGDVSPMHFTGKERDSESGLDNFGARYNSSGIGRFMSPDSGVDQHPEAPQSWNLYSYALNNPVNLVDPTGEYVCGTGITQAMCDNFQSSLNAAQADANKLKETYGADSTEYKDAQRAIDFYGKENIDNGVTLTLGGQPKGAEGQVDPNVGSTTPTRDNPLGQEITVHFAESAFSGSADNAITIGHEGSHGADASDWVKSGFSPAMNPNLYNSEWRAFHVSVSLAVISGYGPLGFFVGEEQKKVYIWEPAWTRQAGWGRRVDTAIDSMLRDKNGTYGLNPNSKVGAFQHNTKGNQ